jgi:putative tricarboxylic transport membrane protein
MNEVPSPTRSMRRVDLGVGLFFVALGLVVLWASQDLAVFARTSPGPGFLPRGLVIIFVVVGGILAVKQFVRPSTGTLNPVGTGGTRRVFAVFVILLVSLLSLEALGFIVAMLILMAGLMFGIERKVTVASVATVVLVPVVSWTLFAVLLEVRLPEGLLFFYF